jgi:hypothetical protein
MCRLSANRSLALLTLREKIRAERFDCDVAVLQRWIAQLDSDRFEEREKATAELLRICYLVESELRSALASATSLEARNRLGRIVAALEQPADAPDLVRWSRCLELLEWDGSAEAEQRIRDLAKRVPNSRLAPDAEQSLKRLRDRRR